MNNKKERIGHIAQKIIELRNEAGWSQAELARKANITPSAVNMIEAGRRNPSLIVVRKLSDALKVSIPEITGEPTQETRVEVSQAFFRKYSVLDELDKSDQELILTMAEKLRDRQSEKGGS